jgi:CsoR family transcriptional regulator, copper-sensing transcriptional repressor
MATTNDTNALAATAVATDTTPGADTGADTGTDAGPGGGCHTEHGYISDKSRYLARLERIEGQARGIHRMVEEETYCIDILTQVSALTKALESVALGLLDDHLKHCVMDAAAEGGPVAEAKLKEASDAIARLVRS